LTRADRTFLWGEVSGGANNGFAKRLLSYYSSVTKVTELHLIG